MMIDRVLEALAMIGDYSDEDVARYAPLAQKNLDLLMPKDAVLCESDESKLAYLVGAKTNYEIALISSQSDGVKSFAAGDVKIVQDDYVELAKAIYSSAMEDAAGIITDKAFCFRSV